MQKFSIYFSSTTTWWRGKFLLFDHKFSSQLNSGMKANKNSTKIRLLFLPSLFFPQSSTIILFLRFYLLVRKFISINIYFPINIACSSNINKDRWDRKLRIIWIRFWLNDWLNKYLLMMPACILPSWEREREAGMRYAAYYHYAGKKIPCKRKILQIFYIPCTRIENIEEWH
jgi:hypothetical protein